MAPSPQKRAHAVKSRSSATAVAARRGAQSAKQDTLQPQKSRQMEDSGQDKRKRGDPCSAAQFNILQLRDSVEASRSKLLLLEEETQKKRKDLQRKKNAVRAAQKVLDKTLEERGAQSKLLDKEILKLVDAEEELTAMEIKQEEDEEVMEGRQEEEEEIMEIMEGVDLI